MNAGARGVNIAGAEICAAPPEFDPAASGVDAAVAEFTAALAGVNTATAEFYIAMPEFDPALSGVDAGIAEFAADVSEVDAATAEFHPAASGELSKLWFDSSPAPVDTMPVAG